LRLKISLFKQFCVKADLGVCPKIHDDDMRKQYAEAKESSRKVAAEDEFLRFCQRMLNDLGHKIKRSKERLLLTQMEQAAANGVPPDKQEEIEEKINILTDKINVLVDQAEQAGCKGDVEEAQGLLKLCDQFKVERDDLKTQIGLKPPSMGADGAFGPQKAMEVCEICGAFLIVGDAQTRIDDHLMGKQHVGYARLRAGVDTILEDRRKRREERDKEKEAEVEERRKKREEERKSKDKSVAKDKSVTREKSVTKDKESSSKDDKKGDRKRSRSRKRSRDRSRDRKRSRSRSPRKRSRSRDRKSSRRSSRSRERDRKPERRRSRSRDRNGRRDRSRDRR